MWFKKVGRPESNWFFYETGTFKFKILPKNTISIKKLLKITRLLVFHVHNRATEIDLIIINYSNLIELKSMFSMTYRTRPIGFQIYRVGLDRALLYENDRWIHHVRVFLRMFLVDFCVLEMSETSVLSADVCNCLPRVVLTTNELFWQTLVSAGEH